MKRYEAEINGGEPWHEPADDGMWVLYDDAQAAIAAAVATEREQWEYALRAALAGMRGLEELMHRA